MREIAFGRFLKFAEDCSASRKNSGALCFNASALKALKRLSQISQRFVLQRALFSHQFFRRGAAGFGGGAGIAGLGKLAAQLRQLRIPLVDLAAEFLFQPRIRTAAARAPNQPADERAEASYSDGMIRPIFSNSKTRTS